MHIAHKKKLGLVDLSLLEYSEGYGFDSPPKQIFFGVLHSSIEIVSLQIFCETVTPSEKVYIWKTTWQGLHNDSHADWLHLKTLVFAPPWLKWGSWSLPLPDLSEVPIYRGSKWNREGENTKVKWNSCRDCDQKRWR
jgi:hypothetical protein